MLQKRFLLRAAVAVAVLGFAPATGAATAAPAAEPSRATTATTIDLPRPDCNPSYIDLIGRCLIPGLLAGSSSLSAD